MKQSRLCPVCRAPSTKTLKEKLPLSLKIQLFILTLACCSLVHLALGPWAALKSSFLYLVFLGFAEVLHWMQMRQNVQCEVCDFDPILYKKDWRKARLQVETKMQGTFNKFSVQMKDTIEFSEIQGTAAGKAKGPQVASALAPIDERVKSAMIVSAAEKAANEVRATGAAKSLLSLKPNAAPTKTP